MSQLVQAMVWRRNGKKTQLQLIMTEVTYIFYNVPVC